MPLARQPGTVAPLAITRHQHRFATCLRLFGSDGAGRAGALRDVRLTLDGEAGDTITAKGATKEEAIKTLHERVFDDCRARFAAFPTDDDKGAA